MCSVIVQGYFYLYQGGKKDVQKTESVSRAVYAEAL